MRGVDLATPNCWASVTKTSLPNEITIGVKSNFKNYISCSVLLLVKIALFGVKFDPRYTGAPSLTTTSLLPINLSPHFLRGFSFKSITYIILCTYITRARSGDSNGSAVSDDRVCGVSSLGLYPSRLREALKP